MGKGRKAKPTWLKVVDGNPGKRALNDQEPKPEAGAKRPRHLTEGARKAWEYLVRDLDACGIVTKVDSAALEVLCNAYAQYVDMAKNVAQYGPVLVHKDEESGRVELRRSPYFAILKESETTLMRCFAEFGMTPSARSRIRLPDRPSEIDEFDQFLDKKHG